MIDVIEHESKFKIIGIVDKPELKGNKVLGYSIIGSDLDLKNLAKNINAFVTAGQIKSPKLRIKLFNLAVKAGFVMLHYFSKCLCVKTF